MDETCLRVVEGGPRVWVRDRDGRPMRLFRGEFLAACRDGVRSADGVVYTSRDSAEEAVRRLQRGGA